MPKTPSTKLFRLIKSMSGSEKRYFKLFAGYSDDRSNKYIRLFDEIDEQEIFDDEALKRSIYGKKPIESRKYSELKAYLYDLILKSLQRFDEKSSIDFKLKNYLQSIRVLYRRSHFEDARQLVGKAKKLAQRYEKFDAMLEMLNWEKQIAYAQTDIAFLDSQLSRIDAEEKDCLTRLQNISSYRNIFFQLLISLRKDASLRNKEQGEKLSAIIRHPLLADESLAGSHQARILYHRIYSVYYYAQKKLSEFYQVSQVLLSLMEGQVHFLKEDVSEYISALSNLTLACGWLKKHDEVEKNLEKFRNITPITQDDELKIHRQYYMNKFALSIVIGDFKEGLKALEQHQEEIRRFSDASFRKHTFFFQYFYIYFGNDDYNKALEYLNEWLNLSSNIERKDLQSLARILNLIVHYEMGNSILLESLLRSTYRFLKKQERINEYERLILNFIRNSGKIVSKKELKQAYLQLKEDLEGLFQQKEERAMLEMFDIVSWVESKIQNQAFAQVKQEKYQAQLTLQSTDGSDIDSTRG
jgi:hypothetical protein